MENVEPIIYPLWVNSDERFRSRNYHAWDRSCAICGRKVVVSSAAKRQLGSEPGNVIICEHCALSRSEDMDALQRSESKTAPACPTCEALRQQEESAAAELGVVTGVPSSEEARRKWAHIFTARLVMVGIGFTIYLLGLITGGQYPNRRLGQWGPPT